MTGPDLVLLAARQEPGIGGWGLVIVLGMLGGSVGLFFAMRRSLRRINFVEAPPEDPVALPPGPAGS
jgi:hypothetical protein